MLVKIFATKPDGYWWKAPSWTDGKGFSLEHGTDVELDAADFEALKEHVKAGYWLRYELAEAGKPEPKAEPIADKAEKKK